jgi:hypothetical protein
MPVVGIYTKDFPIFPGTISDSTIIVVAEAGNNVTYRTTVSGIVTDARVTSKLLTGLSVTGGAVVATDTILQAFGKVQNQINGKQETITLTTTGTSGAATLIGSTLNIPNYAPDLSGYVTLNTAQTITAAKTFSTSGNSDTLIISHSSGSGVALTITKGGNGEGIIVNKTSGSGNAVTITGTLNATTLVKSGGTSSQFLKADGTVDSTAYGTGSVTSVAALTLGTTGTDLSSTVANGTTTPVITLNVPTASASNRGALSAADWTTFNNKTSNTGTVTSVAASAGTGISVSGSPITTSGTLTITNTAPDQTVVLTAGTGISTSGTYPNFTITNTSPSSGGTVTSVGLSSATSGVTIGSTPVTTSGTITLAIATASGSQNGLLSSTDWTTFNNKQSALTNPVTGTGTTNTLPKFTGSTTIGDSAITDNGTTVTLVSRALSGTSATFSSSVTSSLGSSATNFNSNAATTGAVNAYRVSNTTGIGSFGIDNSTGGDLMIGGLAYATLLQSVSNTALQLGTNQTARLTITSGGNVLIGTTTDAGFKLDVNGTFRASGAATFSGNVTANSFIKSGGTSSQFLKADGSVDSTAYGTASTFTLSGTGSTTSFNTGVVAETSITPLQYIIGNPILMPNSDAIAWTFSKVDMGGGTFNWYVMFETAPANGTNNIQFAYKLYS